MTIKLSPFPMSAATFAFTTARVAGRHATAPVFASKGKNIKYFRSGSARNHVQSSRVRCVYASHKNDFHRLAFGEWCPAGRPVSVTICPAECLTAVMCLKEAESTRTPTSICPTASASGRRSPHRIEIHAPIIFLFQRFRITDGPKLFEPPTPATSGCGGRPYDTIHRRPNVLAQARDEWSDLTRIKNSSVDSSRSGASPVRAWTRTRQRRRLSTSTSSMLAPVH
ncbi:hypothetical protein EVAR_57783_1 [Eumeta japonica]|uniref:Uncharacterized protein n=1 Tax=Eumeta variegata TaxID=151549 RepID=A0A4C1Y9A3_EUMVA|nr:hypothetical protein EVAR_57783_1 [Eumeta japonica]